MEIKWLGTAGFEIKTNDQVFLIDPYLSRNQKAFPKQDLKPCDIKKASQIFISHGHFDHIMDVPQISKQTSADIYCPDIAADFFKNHQVKETQIKSIITDQKTFNFQEYSARAFFSEHIKFDKKLIFSTLLKINFQFFKYLPFLQKFPCGQVLSWRFYIEDKVIQFFGSAGSSLNELKKIKDTAIDILLLPMQGHSDICGIGLDYVKVLKPKIVIPHHHDNFFPPISKLVDIKPFVDKINNEHRDTSVIIPKMNETIRI